MKTLGITFLLLLFVFTNYAQTSSGNALEFDGTDDYVEIDSNLTFASMTVEAWVYSSNWNVDGISEIVMGNLDTDGWRINITDSLEINIYDGDTEKSLIWDDDALSGWNHIAFSISTSDSLRLYVNGAAVGTAVEVTTSLESDTSINTLIGAQVDTSGTGADTMYFAGKLDEVRVWSDIRTTTEINTYMYSELDGTEANLEAYYKMSDGSGTTLSDDDDQGLNDGALNNMDNNDWVTSTIFFSGNNALDFTGSDSILFTNNFDGTNFTIEMWFDVEASSNWFPVFSNSDGTGGFEMSYLASGPDILYTEYEDGGTQNVQVNITSGWNHVAITKSPTELNIYLNGILEGSANLTSYTSPSADTSIIGGKYGNFADFFLGQIDEFRAWSVVRTASEIREYMCQTIDPSTTGLEAYLNFNHSSSSSAYDQTGNGNNGSLENMDSETSWISSTAVNTWLGGSSSSWSDADNWSLGTAPTSTHSLGFFSYNEGNTASINDSRTVRNLFVGSSATVGATSDFSVDENLILQGDITFATDDDICTIGNDWILESSASATLEDSSKVTITGDTENEGTILLKSPANMGTTASLITTGGLTNNGTMQIERFITQGTGNSGDYNWHMMSPVLNDTFSAQVYFNGDWVYSYNEPDSSWININTDSIMSPGVGYIIKSPDSDKTYTYSGTFNDGEVNISLVRTDDVDSHGFNLVGNPYPSVIDWNAASGWDKSDIGNDVWIWNPADTLYAVWDGTTSTNDGSRYIHPGQAFFVQVNTGQTSGTLTMNDDVRTHTTDSVFFKSASEELNLIKLAVFDGLNKDEWAGYISDKPNTTKKFFSFNPNKSQIYSYLSDPDKPLAIHKIEKSDTMLIPLGIHAVNGKKLKIRIIENSFNTEKYQLHLKDGDILTPLSDIQSNGYTFTHDNLTGTNRFSLVVVKKSTTGIEDRPVLPEHITMRIYQGNVELTNMADGAKSVKIYDIAGREVLQRYFTHQTEQFRLPQHGVFIMQMKDSYGVYVKKFVY